jgi:hypothetical protein
LLGWREGRLARALPFDLKKKQNKLGTRERRPPARAPQHAAQWKQWLPGKAFPALLRAWGRDGPLHALKKEEEGGQGVGCACLAKCLVKP